MVAYFHSNHLCSGGGVTQRPEGRRPSNRREAAEWLVEQVKGGRPVVPLAGAGISIEAGVPPLSELTRYLARSETYLNERAFTRLPPDKARLNRDKQLSLPDFLHDFGWPDPNELTSELWHWCRMSWCQETPKSSDSLGHLSDRAFRKGLKCIATALSAAEEKLGNSRKRLSISRRNDLERIGAELAAAREKLKTPRESFPKSMDRRVALGILEGLKRTDKSLAENLRIELERPDGLKRWHLSGSYWQILLRQMTRWSPELIDTLFQRLTRKREPATAHRYLAFLTPVLRLRLFLTINFDTLLEDALRAEGLRPTLYEVAEGLSLPHEKLMEEGLSVVKLHGGSYGLLVGDKLDSPLSKDAVERFLNYLPDRPILLVMGVGGWDERVLDMVTLTGDREGDVLWLHFEREIPDPLNARRRQFKDPKRLMTFRARDPGAFLREVYSLYKKSHPSSSLPFQPCDLRPVPAEPGEAEVPAWSGADGRLVIFEDSENDFGLGASLLLAEFVASKAETHLPVWIDLETKWTVEDVLVELIQILRRYDPGLPPELLVMERSTDAVPDFGKVVRRLYAALSRGRYLLAFNGVQSFGRPPMRHDSDEISADAHVDKEHKRLAKLLRAERTRFDKFLRCLIEWIDPNPREERPRSLGLLDSMLAFAVDHPASETATVVKLLRKAARNSIMLPIGRKQIPRVKAPPGGEWKNDPKLILLSAFRRRRSHVSLLNLLPNYLDLSSANQSPEEAIKGLTKDGILFLLEGGDYWMSRKLRNRIYGQIRQTAVAVNHPDRLWALAALAFVHHDLAEYHHREIYVGSRDTASLLEELYHRMAALRYQARLADLDERVRDGDLKKWIEGLAKSCSHARDDTDDNGREAAWTRLERVVDIEGKLVLCQRLVQELRAVREILDQERETLLCRVPGVTFGQWVQAVRDDLKEIDPGKKLYSTKGESERELLEGLLDDIEVEILQDRMRAAKVIELRDQQLYKRRVRSGHPGVGWKLTVKWLENLCTDRDAKQSPWEQHLPVVQALMDMARAAGRKTGDPIAGKREAERYSELLGKLLRSWRPPPAEPIPVKLFELRVMYLRLLADQELWGISPWATKNKGLATLGEQHKNADAALRYSEEALQILGFIREEDPTMRSYFYSLRGRALYLKSQSSKNPLDFDDAYRELDLARADLSAAKAGERETLAIAILRQAECLMVHADEEIVRWVIRRAKRLGVGNDKLWRSLLSNDQIEIEEDKAEALLRISLGMFRDDFLQTLDESKGEKGRNKGTGEGAQTEQNKDQGGESQEPSLSDVLDMARSRLTAAGELLDRVEGLLEGSRRKVEWWACLFQLRAQLAVERLLLLLTVYKQRDATKYQEASGERVSGERAGSGPSSANGQSVADAGDAETSGIPSKVNPRRDSNGGTEDGARALFNHRLQSGLHDGVMAVRQGLDVLLPDNEGRSKGLEGDFLVARLLQSWVALMVCGAYATVLSRSAMRRGSESRTRKPGEVDLWNQWCHLNWLHGLVTLPRCIRVRKWFRGWCKDLQVERPGLSVRGHALAQFDQRAVAWLQETLKKDAEDSIAAKGRRRAPV